MYIYIYMYITWQSNTHVQFVISHSFPFWELPIAVARVTQPCQGNSERRLPSFRESHLAGILEETLGPEKQVVTDVMRNLMSNSFQFIP